MIYNEVKQFINDGVLQATIKKYLSSAKAMVDKWNSEDSDFTKINDLVDNIIMSEFNRYENYLTLWWEDSDEIAVNEMKFIKMMQPFLISYGKEIMKVIESFVYMLKENNWKIENITGTSHRLSRNEGYSNFQSSSIEEQNNWSNVVVRTDKSDVGDLFTLFQFYSDDIIRKMVDEIARNTMVMIY